MKVNIPYKQPYKVKAQFTKTGHIYRHGEFLYLRLKENPTITPILAKNNDVLFLNLGNEAGNKSECFTAVVNANSEMELVGEAEIKLA